MSGAGVRNPFRPGQGGLPPYFAGREAEQALFREVMDDLRSGVPVARSLVVYGPRGNGKTALLARVEREADGDDRLEARWLTGGNVPDPDALVKRLELPSLFGGLSAESFSVGGLGVSLRRGEAYPPLEARAKVTPLLLLLDEAHTLKPEVGQWLLNAAQTAARRAPFLLVLAGTPDLRARLSEMGASFWNRATKLPVGRLDETAAAEAIRRPLAEDGIAVEEEALARMVGESHGYPFFVQLWGRAVWDRVRKSGAGAVTAAVVEEAAGEFEAERNDYYLDRHDEMEKQGWLGAAREVALAFRDRTRLPQAEFRSAIRRAASVGDRAAELATAAAFEHLGFVWKTRGTPSWEPGIPSLMDYIVQHAPPPDEEGDEGGG